MTLLRVVQAPFDDAGGSGGADLTGRTIRGRYRVERRVGRGPLGVVYRAVDAEQGRPVALKVFGAAIDPEGDEARRMLADLETAAGLLNPHLLPALDAGIVDGRLFVVEPLLDGASLAERLDENGPLAPMDAVRIALEVLVALDALHRHHILHLDLRPENVFVVADPVGLERVLVGGVGQQHALGLDRAPGRAPGSTLAPSEYLAPEIVSGKPRDVRTDLYQLGLLMYACLTGDPPFTGRDPASVARRHALERPPSPQNVRPEAGVPDALDTVVVRCLEKVPRKRYSSAMEMTRALEDVARKGAPVRVSGRFRAVSSSSRPPGRPRANTGSLDGSMEEPPPFADFDHEPPPAGPQTQLDVRRLLSAPPKIDRPPRIRTGPVRAMDPAAASGERPRRPTPPIGSGMSEADLALDAAPAEPTPGPMDLVESGRTLVDPLFRPPIRPPSTPDLEDERDDRDDTGSHDQSLFPGAALLGAEEERRGVDSPAARAPTAPVDLAASTLLGHPGRAAAEGEDPELARTAFDGGAASKAAAAAVAEADRIAAGQAEQVGQTAQTKQTGQTGQTALQRAETGRAEAVRPSEASDAPDGPTELGASAAAADEGWQVGDDPAFDADLAEGLPRRSPLPWVIAALVVAGVAAFFLVPRDETPPPVADDVAEKITIDSVTPPAPAVAAQPEPVAEPAPPGPAALEAQARSALAAKRWRGADDALVERLAALRAADPDGAAADEIATRGAEALLVESRAAMDGGAFDDALERARTALAVAPAYKPATRQIEDIESARRLARNKADAERKAAERKAAEVAQREAAEAEKREAAEAEKRQAAEAEQRKAAEADAAAARRAAEREAAEARAAVERAAAADDAEQRATEARLAAEAERAAQAKAERAAREEAARKAREEADATARDQARQEARARVAEGRGHVAGGRWAEAQRAFEAALERDKRNAAAHAGLGEVAFQQQRFADAVTHHRRAVERAPKNAGHHINLGMAYFKLDNFAQAKASWQKAVELDPDNAKARRYLELVERKL